MAALSQFVGVTNNLQFASVVLSGASGTASQTFPGGGASNFRIPFNGILANPYNLITLNTSLSTLTVPTGLYEINLVHTPRTTTQGIAITTRVRDITNNITLTKWPFLKTADSSPVGSVADIPLNNYIPAGIYLSSTTSIALEQYWSASAAYSSGISDNDSNIYCRMDIWKLR